MTDTDPGDRDQPPATPLPADQLAALLARPGTTAVRVEHGDELLLLMPDVDDATAEAAATTLAEAYPSVGFLILAGVTGAVIMPRREPADGHDTATVTTLDGDLHTRTT